MSVCVESSALPDQMMPRRSASTTERARVVPSGTCAHGVARSEADSSTTENSTMMTAALLEHLASLLDLPLTVTSSGTTESTRITTITVQELMKKLTPPSLPKEVLSAPALTNVVERGPCQSTDLAMLPVQGALLDPAIRRHGF